MAKSFTFYPFSEYGMDMSPFVKQVTVDQFTAQLNDGDLIFSRSDSFEGHLIQLSGHCIWNHVAMCLRKHWCESTNDDTVYTHDNIETKNSKTGVKLWHMGDGIKQFLNQGNNSIFFGVARLRTTDIDRHEHEKRMWNFWIREQGKPYTPNYSTLVLSWLDSFSSITSLCYWPGEQDNEDANQLNLFKNKSTTESYFCSQIIVQCLMETNMLIDEKYSGIPATEWTVADLANSHRLKNNLRNNFKYTEIEFFNVTL